jgi:hypothetical protein
MTPHEWEVAKTRRNGSGALSDYLYECAGCSCVCIVDPGVFPGEELFREILEEQGVSEDCDEMMIQWIMEA